MSEILAISALRAGYGEIEILHGIELRLCLGEWLGLVGPNGSGKSTLLACLSGHLAPSAGSVAIDGYDLQLHTLAARQRLGYAMAPELLPRYLSGEQCLAVYSSARGLVAPEAELLQLADALRFTPWLTQAVASYSYGTRQKLALLLALLGEPRLVVLDESFNGLDPASALVLKRHLRARVDSGRCSVVLATHALDIVERYADRAVLLYDGRLLRGWNANDLARLRAMPGEGLEGELALAMQAQA